MEARLNLARAVLAEIPDQVTGFMFANKKIPQNQDAPPDYTSH